MLKMFPFFFIEQNNAIESPQADHDRLDLNSYDRGSVKSTKKKNQESLWEESENGPYK